jgi:hypothetical protein
MLTTAKSKNQAVSKLEFLIERGRSRAANVIDHVMCHQLTLAKVDQTLHPNAIYHMAHTTDMPVKFFDSLEATAEPWGRELLAHNLQNRLQPALLEQAIPAPFTAAGSAGISDSYRRIDSRPVVEAFCRSSSGEGGV